MKCSEKLKLEHPDDVNKRYVGGFRSCPSDYGYLDSPDWCECDNKICAKCWDREITDVEPTKHEHDGCVECKHFDKEEPDYPCSDCKGTAAPGSQEYYKRDDLFEPEEVDMVNKPPHYTNGIECIDEMIAVFGKEVVADFCLCNVWKYRKRASHKNGQEDLDKADWYMKKFMELEGKLPDPLVKLP